MVRRVQFKFWLIAMAAMGFCVIALIIVINLINAAQTERQIDRALGEMVATVESLRDDTEQQAAQETDTEWRVESYVEEEEPADTQVPEPEESGMPENTPDRMQIETSNAVMEADPGPGKDDRPRDKDGRGGKQPWWYEDFAPQENQEQVSAAPSPKAPEQTAETVPTPSPEVQETVVNHYYYYYPADSDSGQDLRSSAMNQYAGRLCVVSFPEGTDPVVGMSDSNVLEESEAIVLAGRMLETGKADGELENYRYQIKRDDSTWVYFLDCTTEYQARRSMLLTSILVGFAGLLVTGLFVYLMSRRAIAPLKESMNLQKRFITDAGHELKTPLAVIGTNMDILEMDIGRNEWVTGTKKQLVRLRKLVANLISLSRLEEMQTEMELQPFDLSQTASECVDSFTGQAELAGKELRGEIAPDIRALGDVTSVGQMISILCDNAVKYAQGDIQVRLYASGKHVYFETENDWDHGIPPEELPRLFDRFYRGDKARSGETGQSGYGLGLSIAKAIAEKNRIRLTVAQTGEGLLRFQAELKKI